MAQVTTTETLSKQKESVINAIFDVSSKETPALRLFGKGKAPKNTFHQWQVDKLRDPKDNAQVENTTFTFEDHDQPSTIGNYSQILQETVALSGTAAAVKVYGRKNEWERARMKKRKELMLDLEHAFVGGLTGSVGGDDPTVPRRSASFGSFLESNVSMGAGGATGGYDSTTKLVVPPTAGTSRAFEKQQITDTAQAKYQNGSTFPTWIMMPPALRGVFSTFVGNVVSENSITMKTPKSGMIIDSVDLIKTDFGILKVVTNRHQAVDTVLMIDPDYVEVGYLREFELGAKDDRQTSDGFKQGMNLEAVLVNKNEAAHCAIFDVAA